MESRMTLHTYLVLVAMRDVKVSMVMAMAAVDSLAVEHPEWDMQERRTFDQWLAWERGH
jgi:hypothetical protein